MRNRHSLAAVLLTASLSLPAAAEDYGEPGSYWISAPVVDVTPILSQRTVRHPVRQCTTASYREDDYDYRQRSHHSGSYFLPGLFGGLVGGLIGNQFGGGSGKKALTIVGALAGSSIARDAARNREERRTYSRPMETCRTTYQNEVIDDVTAYDVTYEYAGRRFNKRMNTHPGDSVRVRVALDPIPAG